MLPSVPVALQRAGRFAPVHPASTVLHRSIAAGFPGPPRIGAASLALVHR